MFACSNPGHSAPVSCPRCNKFLRESPPVPSSVENLTRSSNDSRGFNRAFSTSFSSSAPDNSLSSTCFQKISSSIFCIFSSTKEHLNCKLQSSCPLEENKSRNFHPVSEDVSRSIALLIIDSH